MAKLGDRRGTQAVLEREILKHRRVSREARAGYCFTVPLFLHVLVFVIAPILFGFYLSLRDWNGFSPIWETAFVGIRQYINLFRQDSYFPKALVNTIVFSLGSLVTVTVSSLSLALILNTMGRGIAFWRTVYFIPFVLSLVSVSLVWKNIILQPSFGVVNRALAFLELPQHQFFRSPREALASIVAMETWRNTGYFMVIFAAGLKSIPSTYYDAAKTDGARAWQLTRFITLPLLRPTVLFVLIMNTIWTLQVFDPVYVITGGGPGDSTNVVVYLMYNTAFSYKKFSSANAMSFVLFVLIFGISLLEMKFLSRGGLRSY